MVGNRTVTLKTNDPSQPTVSFTVHARVGADIEVEPSRIEFGHVKANELTEREFALVFPSSNEQLPDIYSLSSTNSDVTVRFLNESIGGNRHVLKYVAVGTFRPISNGIHGSILINTASSRTPQIEVPFEAQPLTSIAAEPPIVLLSILKANSTATKHISLHRRISSVSSIMAKSEDERVTAAITGTSDPNEWKLTIDIEPNGDTSPLDRPIQILDEDQNVILEIPVLGIIQ